MKAVCAETQVAILAHQRKVFEEVVCNKPKVVVQTLQKSRVAVEVVCTETQVVILVH